MNEVTSEQELSLATFWQRAFATFIDMVLMSVILGAVFLLIIMVADSMNSTIGMISIGSNLLMFVGVIYFWAKKQGTPGKIILGLRIVDRETLGEMSIAQMIIRQLMYIPSSFFMLGFIWMLFDENNQCWHDKVSSTVVVRD